ncbi:MAG: glycosidase, partial [Bacteroidales bacterium]|nr:glycosidase [Bacteroidales bacterium]
VTYAFRPFPPGQYWRFAHDEVLTRDMGDNAPDFLKRNIANSALAITKDFKKWRRLGRITQSHLDDRDVILFPEKINGKYAMLHRPKEWVGEGFGPKYPAVWIRFSNDLLNWDEPSQVLIEGIEGSWEEKVGGSTPPIKTDKGWFVLYHGVENGGKGYYRVGAMMLDLNDPTKVIARTRNFLMEPEHYYEIEGFYKGCVFPTGNVVKDGILYVYYGGADKYVGVATADFNELVDKLLNNEL